ncbi:unnamed protein product [Linum tenue]|uniref:AT1G08220-like protein n=1 Tax=Linum tenue TaxID=586396 RepID=A0AAV0N2P8_9ROSI|nr:unnamed protein product [Linum tenue]
MLRANRFTNVARSTRASLFSCEVQEARAEHRIIIDLRSRPQLASVRFLDFYQLGNKAAIEKERARITDEMNRGYFADMSEFKKHGGKIARANKIIIPAETAAKFPDFDVNFSDGRALKLPTRFGGSITKSDASDFPNATLLCLSFRASSQGMIDSWTVPFLDAYRDGKNIQLYQVSFIDSWLLCRSPIKRLLLRTMKKSTIDESRALQKQIAYSFGDNYYFRKELKILNLLTGYIYLLDKFGRIRWQGSGSATEEELSSLLSCTSLLLQD